MSKFDFRQLSGMTRNVSSKATDLIGSRARKRKREEEREYLAYTMNARNVKDNSKELGRVKKRKSGPDPEWYKPVSYYGPPAAAVFLGIMVQYLLMTLHNMFKPAAEKTGYFHWYPGFGWYIFIAIIATPIFIGIVYKKTHAQWLTKNAIHIDDDMEDRPDDAYIRTVDHLALQLDIAPDVGLGFKGHASTLMSHIMMSNKGINKIKIPVYDKSVDGFIKRDENGDIVYETKPMFDEQLAHKLYDMSGVPPEFRIFYNAKDYDFNPIDKKSKKRVGDYGRMEYDTLADVINNTFYPLDTETARPAGVYFYDRRPVNTILIAITRGGKGQTYIEPAFDVWLREDEKWNIFTTDPKGELIGKFYYSATVRGYEVVQFNLMNPNLTNTFNPLINALQKFRQNDDVKGQALIDGIVDTLWPDNGEIWNPAAGNMFRRAVYMLFAIYIDQERYIRYLGYKNKVAPELIEQSVNDNYSKITLFNVYSLVGELAAKISKDVDFINIDPAAPPVSEKDLFTLAFDAMAMLPTNNLRSQAITANNAIKQIASAPQTLAGIYASLMTGLSVYADDTTRALMSGSLTDSFDVGGMAFPRRFGVQFDSNFVQEYRITKELAKWTCYKDKDFKVPFEGADFEHEEKISPSNWAWCYLKGIFPKDKAYLKLEIQTDGAIAKTFYFEFIKGYKTSGGVSYIIDPITKKKVVYGGILVELDPLTKRPQVSTYTANAIDYARKTMSNTQMPIIASSQVFYSERPKFLFAITPPHLQQYQRHILVIIKQIIDEIYAYSYVVKNNRKPIVGTRMMLEELGNIRSGDKGIPNLDTITSIALGQDLQLTFVLQSFQQLRSVYGEDVEKIIRANSANTIFLKSNDAELIDELVRLSGVKHITRNQGRSVAHKLGDVVTVAEPVMTYNTSVEETTALTSNELLFLANPSPGNAITFSQGEMPIMNKLDTIMPMAAGLHSRLPQPKTGQYADSTLPSTNDADSINILENIIDGEAMVKALVSQAKIAQDVKKVYLQIAKDHDITLNERNGELASLMMNTVFEEYERQSGMERRDLAETKSYADIAEEMMTALLAIKDKKISQSEKINRISNLREQLVRCAMDKELGDLTQIYRDKPDNNPIGYDLVAASRFINSMRRKYQKEEKLKVESRGLTPEEFTKNMTKTAKEAENPEYEYKDYDNGDLVFDNGNSFHREALERVIQEALDGLPTSGLAASPIQGQGERYNISISGVLVGTYEQLENSYMTEFTVSNRKMAELVLRSKPLYARIQEYLREL